MGIIARLTMRNAVEQIAREMDGPRTLVDIAREAARRSGRPYTDYTTRTVADALARLRYIVRCAPGTYAPARVALDGKAFRVPLTDKDVQCRQLSKRRLEPFFSALGKPPVRTPAGEELPTLYLPEGTMYMLKEAAVRATARALRETPWLERYLGRMNPEKMLAEAWDSLSISHLDTGFIDLTPLGLDRWAAGHRGHDTAWGSGGEGLESTCPTTSSGSDGEPQASSRPALDLIVRWDHGADALTVTVTRRPGANAPDGMACEDRVLGDFLASRLLPDHAVSLGDLLLEAYARFPQVGRLPGSAPMDVVQRDRRMRITAGDATRLDEVLIARADVLTWQERRLQGEGAAYDDWAVRYRRELRATSSPTRSVSPKPGSYSGAAWG